MKLSKRLEAVAELVTSHMTIADIGTDHAYIPIFLIQKNKVKHAIAMDINEGPLERAKEHVIFEELEEKIELRLSDGAKALLRNEAESVVIAGMGGNLVIHILEEGREVLDTVPELILQPQSDLERVRRYLKEQGYSIDRENMILEDGKYYPMMRVYHKQDDRIYSKTDYLYGYDLIHQKHPVLVKYLEKEEKQYREIFQHLKSVPENEMQQKRLFELEQKIKLVQEARLEMFEK